MLGKNILLKNTLLLTLSSLIIRFIGMFWQVWLVGKIGEAGIGLYQLILSLGSFAVTISISGIRYAATRLISSNLSLRDYGKIKLILLHCFRYAIFFGIIACLFLFCNAERLAFMWLEDVRAIPSIRWLSFSMPVLAVSTVIYGYFTAVGRVWKSALSQIIREILMMTTTLLLLRSYIRGDVKQACICIFNGAVVADYLTFAILILFFIPDIKQYSIQKSESAIPHNSVIKIALPIAIASYAKSGLSTLQHILVPKGLKFSGLSSNLALAAYGTIQGMALPVVLFPSCLMMSLAEMIVPELTQKQIENNKAAMQNHTENFLAKSFIISMGICAIIYFFSNNLSSALYDSNTAGQYIHIFSLIIPVMYMDMITDGCLKGLGEMMFCMYVNIADAGLSAILVWLLLPKHGIPAYISIICFTEIFNFIVSMIRLKRITAIKIHLFFILKTIFFSFLSAGIAKALHIITSAGNSIPALVISMILGVVIYAVFALSALRRQ